MKCATPICENTSLIYSGVDAFMLGVPMTEKYCYTCGQAYYTIKNEVDALVESEKSNG